MNLTYRLIGFALASLMTILAVGFFLEQPWVLGFWPWPIKGLSYAFVSSILAAIAAPVFWICITNEPAAICGGAINLLVTFVGFSVYSFFNTQMPGVQTFGIVSALFAAACLVQVFVTYRVPFKDDRRMPVLVRYSFLLFATILTYVGGMMVTHRANMFPWPLKPEHQVLYGWIFLGAACYFVYGFVRPVWGNLRGQLWGFLAYDLVLIVPYSKHFATVPEDLRTNLIIYVCVLVYSGLLAIYALFASRPARLGPG
ncbi:MAG: hypothetical protein K1X67_00505 [Fimbriimonadaceae bacterium]|nr:hypothetical protein [Fimbriimonadaceae bacterium]